jgi:hypothetical protein
MLPEPVGETREEMGGCLAVSTPADLDEKLDSRGGAFKIGSSVPHSMHQRASSGFWIPHSVQYAMI